MNWKLFGGFGVLISVILALSLGLTLPKKNADPDQDTETHTLTSKIYYLGLGSMASIVAERSEAREPNGKQTSELNSVGPKTPKSIEIFWFGPLPVMTSSQLIRFQRPLPPSWLAVSKNENITLEAVFCKLPDDIFFHFRFENFPFPVRLFCP